MALKGKTTFELTNVETGEVRVVEDNNMLTNGLKYLLTSYPALQGNTNVIQKLMTVRTDSYDSASSGLTRKMKMLTGGLILFDTALEENVENIFPPAGVETVGCGMSKAYSGANVMAGGYNQVESGTVTDEYEKVIGYKHVWDFSTSQGNGHIACACLTTREGGHAAGGTYPYDSAYVYTRNDGYDVEVIDSICHPMSISIGARVNCPLLYADANKGWYALIANKGNYYQYHTVNQNNSFMQNRKLEIELYQLPVKEYSILDYSTGSGNGFIKTVTIEMPDSLKSVFDSWVALNSSAVAYYGFSSDNGFVYFWFYRRPGYTSGGIAEVLPNDPFHIWKINMDDFSSTHFEVPNTTGKTLTVYPNRYYYECQYCYVTNEYMLVTATDGCVYNINLQDPTNVSQITYPNDAAFKVTTGSGGNFNNNNVNGLQAAYTIGNKVHFLRGAYSMVIDLTTNRVFYEHLLKSKCIGNSTSSDSKEAQAIYVQNSPLVMTWTHYDYYSNYRTTLEFRILSDMLLTINNLDTPVTKTAAETMKVTYTLLETEDVEGA